MRAEQRAKLDVFLNAIGLRPIVMSVINLMPDSAPHTLHRWRGSKASVDRRF